MNIKKWPDISMQATECALYYCVKNVDSSVRQNILIENITEARDITRQPSSWQRSNEYGDALPSTKAPPEEMTSLEFNELWSAVHNAELVLANQNNKSLISYAISSISIKSLSAHMQTSFLKKGENEPRLHEEIQKKLGKNAVGFNGASFGPRGLSLLTDAMPAKLEGLWSWNRQNVFKTFDALAMSMTNEMRRNYEPSQPKSQTQTTRQGNERGKDTEGTLNYKGEAWIVAYSVMMLSVMLFLAVTLWSSDTRDGRAVPLWKSSYLASIKHGSVIGDLLERTMTVGDVEQEARKLHVKVLKEEDESIACIKIVPSTIVDEN